MQRMQKEINKDLRIRGVKRSSEGLYKFDTSKKGGDAKNITPLLQFTRNQFSEFIIHPKTLLRVH